MRDGSYLSLLEDDGEGGDHGAPADLKHRLHVPDIGRVEERRLVLHHVLQLGDDLLSVATHSVLHEVLVAEQDALCLDTGIEIVEVRIRKLLQLGHEAIVLDPVLDIHLVHLSARKSEAAACFESAVRYVCGAYILLTPSEATYRVWRVQIRCEHHDRERKHVGRVGGGEVRDVRVVLEVAIAKLLDDAINHLALARQTEEAKEVTQGDVHLHALEVEAIDVGVERLLVRLLAGVVCE